jgi:glycosyltransferase involved in cell wall biosynthesis
MAIAEAYACGVPVIAAGHGGLAEIVHDGYTGLHFTPGDPDDLALKVEWAWTHPREMETMGLAARVEFETKYNASAALKSLENAYESVHSGREESVAALRAFVQSEAKALLERRKGAG